MQQLQAPLTLVWAAVFLGESVTLAAVLATLVVIGSVLWAQRGASPPTRRSSSARG